MTRVILFHHALGLTPGIVAFADRLRAAGHEVHTPDLFEGRTFDSIEAGVAHAEEVGFGEIIGRGAREADRLDGPAVYAGFSLGVLPAQMLAQTRTDALAAVLCYSCVPASEFGGSWPDDVPVQIHGMDADPFFVGEGDVDAAREIVASAADAELFLYPGDQHYFADSSQPSYDAAATDLLVDRMIELLERAGDTSSGRAPGVDLAGLRSRWSELEGRWAVATQRAAALPAGAVDERVDGEWSFAETLRHLVFATDAWLQRPILHRPSPFWAAALPHSECPDAEIAPFGIDRAARPSWDELLRARAERQAMVREYLAGVGQAELARRCEPGAPPPGLGADSDVLTVGECLSVIVEEETAHLGYALRDLGTLEAAAS